MMKTSKNTVSKYKKSGKSKPVSKPKSIKKAQKKKRDPKTYKGGRKKMDKLAKKVRVDLFIEGYLVKANGGEEKCRELATEYLTKLGNDNIAAKAATTPTTPNDAKAA